MPEMSVWGTRRPRELHRKTCASQQSQHNPPSCGTPFAYNDSLHVDTKRTRQLIFNDSIGPYGLHQTRPYNYCLGAAWKKRHYSCLTIEATCNGNQGYMRMEVVDASGRFRDSVNGVTVSNVSLLLVRLPSPPLVLSPFSALCSCPTLRCCLLLLARAFRPPSCHVFLFLPGYSWAFSPLKSTPF